jgi:hypothetical protein
MRDEEVYKDEAVGLGDGWMSTGSVCLTLNVVYSIHHCPR